VVQVAVDMPAAAALLTALPAGGHVAAARAVIEALAVPRGGSRPPAALWPVLIAACREVQEWRRALDLALVRVWDELFLESHCEHTCSISRGCSGAACVKHVFNQIKYMRCSVSTGVQCSCMCEATLQWLSPES
jgi:hypothetical protein